MTRSLFVVLVASLAVAACATPPEPVEEAPPGPVVVAPEEIEEEPEVEEPEEEPAQEGYVLGDEGPAGGWIVYVDSRDDHDGWTYLEAAPAGWHENGEDPAVAWGEVGVEVGAGATARGAGLANTMAALEHSDEYAAGLVDGLVINGFDDWFLPSQDEMFQVYENLFRRDLGGLTRGNYWTSTEAGEDRAQAYNFQTGGRTAATKDTEYRVRPVRAF